jgi:hypothetical protein
MAIAAPKAVPTDLETPSSESSTRGLPSLSFPVSIGGATGLAACGGGGGDGDTSQSGATPLGVAPAPSPPTLPQASRFLAQASVGADKTYLQQVLSAGFSSWLDEQMALPASGSRWDFLLAGGFDGIAYKDIQAGFDSAAWNKLLASPDTLRQRVVLALSEIFVAAIDGMSAGHWQQFAASAYLDILDTHAFGNYRTLLQAISLSPPMGGGPHISGQRQGQPHQRRAAGRELRARVDAVVHDRSGGARARRHAQAERWASDRDI